MTDAESDRRGAQVYRILMVGSVPLAAPWNGADKNLARFLIQNDPLHQFVVQTSLNEPWNEQSVTPIREKHPSAMPTTKQKISAFKYMVACTSSADLVHFVVSLRHPSRLSLGVMRAWRSSHSKPIIHTVPSAGDRQLRRQDFFGDITVVVSKHTQQTLQNLGVSNVVHIYPVVDERYLRPRTNPDQIVIELRLGKRAILYPAHYGETSGINEMLRAFSQLPPQLDDAVLVLACRTHGDQKPEHEEAKVWQVANQLRVASRVRIVSHVDDMPALIKACAVTVLVPQRLSAKMDLPLVILESLMLKRPVIVSQQPPMNEALLGEAGDAVEYGDIGALSNALGNLLADEQLRNRLGEQGYAAVNERCSPKRIVDEYHAVYSTAMQVRQR
jgi:glycosyltransferase involved in cell wall biosynthesis